MLAALGEGVGEEVGNVLVHLYEEIDYGILHESVADALRDYPELIRDLEPLAGHLGRGVEAP